MTTNFCSGFLHRGRTLVVATIFVSLFVIGAIAASAQTAADRNESERSDKLTGGHVETAEFEPGEPDIRITLNVPTFRLTLWQNGKEVKSYYVGVGMKNYPIYIGETHATQIIWNPAWIVPSSDWVNEKKGVNRARYQTDRPTQSLGKMKIPLATVSASRSRERERRR